jgi:SprT protein
MTTEIQTVTVALPGRNAPCRNERWLKIVEDTVKKAEHLWAKKFRPIPVYERRMGGAAGQASTDGYIVLNPDYYHEADYEQIIIHEVAHIIAYWLYGKSAWNHGPLWKHTAKHLGYLGERTHSYEYKAVRQRRKYTYKCKCRKFVVSDVLHGKMQRGQKRHCNNCFTHLTFLNEYTNSVS